MKPMVKNFLYAALILFCTVSTAFIIVKGKSKESLPVLKERTGALASSPEWETTQARVAKLVTDLKAKPGDAQKELLLAKEFMQEGRVTGNYSYYNKAALNLINKVLDKDPKNFDAICFKSIVYLSQHRFAEAKQIAMQGAQMNPYSSFIYGSLVDANVELGNYPEAVKMCDKMVGTRPDIRSYSRVSYLREIHGDVQGAIEAIRMAVSAGFPGSEDTEWARMVLAHLYEDTGSLEKAETEYKTALAERPDYPFAYAGIGRIARYKKDYRAAIDYYQRAKGVMGDASFYEDLIDLYRLNNEPEKSEECARVTLNALLADNISAGKNPDDGHYSDRELANLYLKMKQLDKALEHARIEQQRRPDNIDASETLAWVLYKKGEAAKALPYIQTAMRTNSQNPERLVRAGLIMAAAGQQAEGKVLMEKGLSLKPYMDEELAKEGRIQTEGR